MLGVPVPAYGGRSLPNVTSSVVRALGREPRGAPPLLPPLEPDLDPFGGRRAEGPIVLLLVDGLGWYPPPAREGFAAGGFPSTWTERLRPISSVFPTTTTVALTSLSTGESPGRHGVVGHRVYLPRFGAVTEILRMSPVGVAAAESLAGPEWTSAAVSAVPNIFRRGIPGSAVSRERFQGSAFTRLLYEGAEYVPYSTAADFAHRLAELLGRPDPPSLIFAYWDELDTVEHLRGPLPEFAAFESAQVERILATAARRVARSVARRTTVLLTSDHGQVAADRSGEIAVDRERAIRSRLRHPPAGDRRAGFFAAREGELDGLEEALARRLPRGHRIVPMRTAIDRGLFGPPPYHPELESRLGDLLVLVPSPAAITYRVPGAPAHRRFSIGAHGGLEPAELLVPFVAGRLADLAGPPSAR